MRSNPSEDEFFQLLKQDILGTLGILRRPVNQLRALSPKQRWEVTRRHPYYLQCWKPARDVSNPEPGMSEDAENIPKLAKLFIGAIGVGHETVDPQLEFHQFPDAGGAATAWLYGTAHPVSIQGQLSLLIAALPPATLARIGRILINCFAEGAETGRAEATWQLLQLQDPTLKKYVDEPFLSVSPTASVRELLRDLPVALKPWRDRPGIVPHRDRSAQVAKYLKVWDRREGWTAGRYETSAEQTFQEIAKQLRLSPGTTNNHYRSAFELITGHPYTPTAWLKVFGPLKLSGLFSPEVDPIARRRPLVSPTRRPVPDAVISSGSSEESFIATHALAVDDRDVKELLLDIETLLKKGKTFEEMCEEFVFTPDKAPFLQSLWERFGTP